MKATWSAVAGGGSVRTAVVTAAARSQARAAAGFAIRSRKKRDSVRWP